MGRRTLVPDKGSGWVVVNSGVERKPMGDCVGCGQMVWQAKKLGERGAVLWDRNECRIEKISRRKKKRSRLSEIWELNVYAI